MRRFAVFAINGALLLPAAGVTAAQYPDKPIRMVVPFAPSGNNDITAREIAVGLSKVLGQAVVVDNRGGAGGRIGTELVAKAPADGYTMLLGSSSGLTISPAFFHVGYDPLRDFAFTSLVSTLPVVLVTHPSLPASVKELIAIARNRKVTMGSAGVGSLTHLSGARFQLATGIKFEHIAYRGGGVAMVDVMAGQIDLMFELVSSAMGHVQSGRVRALAVMSATRSPVLPGVPTLAEQGVPNVEASTYNGVLLPVKTPREIVRKVHAALVSVLEQPATRENFTRMGSEVIPGTPEQFAARIRNDIAQWKRVRRETGLELE